ncbi:hypothetical protein MF573_26470 [Klebsiella pneumoniae]|nr:hypothetical protein MF573_26470 [Klebsiella pneumoniae]
MNAWLDAMKSTALSIRSGTFSPIFAHDDISVLPRAGNASGPPILALDPGINDQRGLRKTCSILPIIIRFTEMKLERVLGFFLINFKLTSDQWIWVNFKRINSYNLRTIDNAISCEQ